MRTIHINSDGYVRSLYIKDANIEMEVEDDIYEKLCSIPFNHNWRLVNGEFVLESLMSKEALQERRRRECFNIIDNRSQLWYNHLTEEQKSELETWYQQWLDVTETKVIPTKPEWL